jgi:YfiH family protein
MLQARSLSALPGIRHAFFTRAGGVSGGLYESLNGGLGSEDSPTKVAENRARMAAAIGVRPENFLSVYQIHSPNVVIADAPWPAADRPRADAIVTKTPGLGIGIGTADCGPVLFADPDARVVGAAHAGWRGAFTGVLEATIAEMEKLGAKRERISAAAGPMISQRNYEVGKELIDRFLEADKDNAKYFAPAAREGHAMFDLPRYVIDRLQRAGVAQVEDLACCTYADEAQFYSYRRATHRKEPDYGRHINAIALSP